MFKQTTILQTKKKKNLIIEDINIQETKRTYENIVEGFGPMLCV
jgi:hypothetical protein